MNAEDNISMFWRMLPTTIVEKTRIGPFRFLLSPFLAVDAPEFPLLRPFLVACPAGSYCR
jgi:hypothetical protein